MTCLFYYDSKCFFLGDVGEKIARITSIKEKATKKTTLYNIHTLPKQTFRVKGGVDNGQKLKPFQVVFPRKQNFFSLPLLMFSPMQCRYWKFFPCFPPLLFPNMKKTLTGDPERCCSGDYGSNLIIHRYALVNSFIRLARSRVVD